jgi:hypothetical protein
MLIAERIGVGHHHQPLADVHQLADIVGLGIGGSHSGHYRIFTLPSGSGMGSLQLSPGDGLPGRFVCSPFPLYDLFFNAPFL